METTHICNNITIVLVSPQVPENIGLIARTLKNTSFSKLSLVAPNLTQKSFEVAKRARDVLENAVIYNTLQEAIAQSHFVFGTTRRQRAHKIIYNFSDISQLLIAQAMKQKISIVFGPENFGFSQADLELCDSIFYLSANPDFPSYNLAIACGIVCSSLQQCLRQIEQITSLQLARKQDVEPLFTLVREHMRKLDNEEQCESAICSLRRVFTRTHLTINELNLLKSLLVR